MTWIVTTSHQEINLASPRLEQIAITDIAQALSRLARFNGHGSAFYSVAQHSVLVASILPEQWRLQGLLHDATEAYMGDLVSPLKSIFPEFKALENQLQVIIFRRFGAQEAEHDFVKIADRILLATERRDLALEFAGMSPWPILRGVSPLSDLRITPWTVEEAEAQFLSCFASLTKTNMGMQEEVDYETATAA